MAPIFGSHWLPGRGDRTIELGPGVPGFNEIWGDPMFSNLARPHRAPRIGLAVAAASALVGTGGWVALSPPAQAAPTLPANCVQGTVGGAVTCTFGYTGAAQNFTVPVASRLSPSPPGADTAATPATQPLRAVTRRVVGVDWCPATFEVDGGQTS